MNKEFSWIEKPCKNYTPAYEVHVCSGIYSLALNWSVYSYVSLSVLPSVSTYSRQSFCLREAYNFKTFWWILYLFAILVYVGSKIYSILTSPLVLDLEIKVMDRTLPAKNLVSKNLSKKSDDAGYGILAGLNMVFMK